MHATKQRQYRRTNGVLERLWVWKEYKCGVVWWNETVIAYWRQVRPFVPD